VGHPGPAAETTLGGLGTAVAGQSDSAPIFAVLAEHRSACVAYSQASMKSGSLADHTPEWEIAQPITERMGKRMSNAHHEVLTRQPTTLAGVAALLDHVGQPDFLDETVEEYKDHEDYEDFRLNVLTGAHEGKP
jgi:hypothetical protein